MSSGPKIFDRPLLRARQRRARAIRPATFLLDRVAGELDERLSAVLRRFDIAIDLGTPTDVVRRLLAASGKVTTIVAAEFSAIELDNSYLRVAADEEALPFADSSLDLVTSALALQFVNDLPGALIQIRRAPDQRSARHDGNLDAVPRTAPADLYSNSTVALDPATGKLVWYYQHLPADDWDSDYTHERTLLRTRVQPNPNAVKWINPAIKPGENTGRRKLQ